MKKNTISKLLGLYIAYSGENGNSKQFSEGLGLLYPDEVLHENESKALHTSKGSEGVSSTEANISFETSPDHWFVLLEIPDSVEVKQLTLGRRDRNIPDYLPDIDLHRYGGAESGVAPEHLFINSREKTFTVSPGTKGKTYYNGDLIESGRVYKLESGDIFKLGTVELTIQFLSPSEMQGRRAQMVLMKHMDPRTEPKPKIEELIKPFFIEEMQTEYPTWIVKRAEWLVRETGGTLKDALETVLTGVNAQRNARYADSTGSAQAIVPFRISR